MWVVAMDAVISMPRAAGQIPVPRHAAMTAVLIITKLRAVTLRTQRHRVFPSDGFSICQMQAGISFVRVMTRNARQLPVLKLKSLMEFIQLRCLPVFGIRRSHRMAGVTGNGHCLSVMIGQLRLRTGRRRDRINRHGMPHWDRIARRGLWRRCCVIEPVHYLMCEHRDSDEQGQPAAQPQQA